MCSTSLMLNPERAMTAVPPLQLENPMAELRARLQASGVKGQGRKAATRGPWLGSPPNLDAGLSSRVQRVSTSDPLPDSQPLFFFSLPVLRFQQQKGDEMENLKPVTATTLKMIERRKNIESLRGGILIPLSSRPHGP